MQTPRRIIATGVAAGALVLAGPALPARADTSGIVHVVTKPAFGNPGSVYEVWYDRDGSGWRMRQTGATGETNWYADRSGLKIVIAKGSRGGPAGTTFLTRDQLLHTPRAGDFPDTPSVSDYLTRPWVDLAIDPLARVARGEMRIVGETTFAGEAAYDVVYTDPAHGGSGHSIVAEDDGALLESRTVTATIDVATYEILPATRATVSKLRYTRH